MKYVFNTFENASIFITSFEIFYDVKSKKMLNFFMSFKNNDKIEIIFLKKKKQLKNEIYDIIKFAQIQMIFIFDKKYKSFRFENSMYFKLTKIDDTKYYIFKNFSLFIKKIEFFKIKKNSTIYGII